MILVLLPALIFAQGIYVRGGLGIATSLSPGYWYQVTRTTSGSTTQTVDEYKKNGFGSGIPFVLAGGYYLSENFAIELGVDYFMGFSHKMNDDYSTSYHKYNEHATMLSLVPAVVFRVQLDKITPYARLGVKIGILNSLVGKEEYTSAYGIEAPTTLTESTYKDKGGIAIGGQAALGAEYALGDKLSVFAEINIDAISYSPKKGKYTVYKVDGADKLGSMSTNAKEWEYVKSTNSTDTQTDSDPAKYLKYNRSLTNGALILGVKFTIGK